MFGFGGGGEQPSAASPANVAPAEDGGAENAANGAEAPVASAGSKVGSMKAGDYLIHVHI